MGKDYSNVNPKALDGASDGFDAVKIENYERRIKNRINSLREKGYSEDEILLLLFENGCRSNSGSVSNDNSDKKNKSKRYIYTSDIHKK